ncbi:hemerythrin domain-containing protein [Streptomyces albus subsp. chlorinus]|uniref:hemerythrin domain-containing protein n=1 Tax=Streptomyces albus TaxID=1888 RepID=UPI001570D93D|nr:hemerythrin domain-containing protein [Streptomyces albus]NSC20042.1 hemerythrin domain-containing protein [Streptomyces albus subsp. chlorinus]
MRDARHDREAAAGLPPGDVIGVLLAQHSRIRELFDAVRDGPADRREERFLELRVLLAVHETAEEMIVRPVVRKIGGERQAAARDKEEKEAARALAGLEKLDFGSARFTAAFTDFERAVHEHADLEEREEFPSLLRLCTPEELVRMGARLLAVEKAAPTRPHPSTTGSAAAQWALGPFAALLDRVRDAIGSASRH